MASERNLGPALKAWRKHLGLTLESAAERIAVTAEEHGIPKTSRSVPRTHPALLRWEQNEVEQRLFGLGIIAAAYGVTVEELMRPPAAPAKQAIEIAPDEEDAVAAFLEALRRHKRA